MTSFFYLTFDYCNKLYSKKRILYFLVTIIILLSMPILTNTYFGLNDAEKALGFVQYSLRYQYDTNFNIYNFSPIILMLPIIFFFGSTLRSEKESHYLTGGVTKNKNYWAKIVSMYTNVILIYIILLLLYQILLLITGFGYFQIESLLFYVKIIINCFVIIGMSIFLISISSNYLFGFFPLFLYYIVNYYNSAMQYPVTFNKVQNAFYILLPVLIAKEGDSNNLVPVIDGVFGHIYPVLFLCLLLLLSLFIYRKKEL